MQKVCLNCNSKFEISGAEQSFLKKVSPSINSQIELIPNPVLCVGCREQNRLAFRNEFHFFKRKCDYTGKQLISIYKEESPYQVFDPTVWWSDNYDPLKYGRDFDFSRTFFEQFHELNLAVPKAAIQNAKSENSAFTNYSSENKNCYMCAGSSLNEDCYYCSRVISSKSVCDSYDLYKCENCYGCVHSSLLYHCVFSKNCHNSSNLVICENCIGCHDCIACKDLQGKRFCISSQEYSEKDYRDKSALLMAEINQNHFSSDNIKSSRSEYIVASEECTGNQLINCSNCHTCFSLKESQDCRYVGLATNSRDCVDCNFMDRSELMYNSTNLIGNYHVVFAALVWYTSESLYLMNSFNSKNLFGCTGMKRNEYCVLNKQYSKSEYRKLVQKIITQMKETEEWGKYFPASISPFPYNCSVANDYYPLERDVALSKGLTWHQDREPNKQLELNSPEISICSVTKKPFKIIKQEKEICQRLGIKLSDKCPEVRREEMTKNIRRALSNYI